MLLKRAILYFSCVILTSLLTLCLRGNVTLYNTVMNATNVSSNQVEKSRFN